MSPATIQACTLTLQPLSPIHVGSGLTLDPFQYTIEERDGETWLRILDIDHRLSTLSEKQRSEFLTVERRGDWPGLRAWMQSACKEEKFTRYRVLVEYGCAGALKAMASNDRSLGEIHLMIRDADSGRPFIPGSSIKGAIRTAVVDRFASRGDEQTLFNEAARARRSSASFEAAVLGHQRDNGSADLYKDPFRQLAIEDIHLAANDCKIDQIKIVRKPNWQPRPGTSSAEGIAMFRDVTFSVLDGETDIAFRSGARLYPSMQREAKLPVELTFERVCEACNHFYLPRLRHELATFLQPRPGAANAEVVEVLERSVASLDPNQCLIRLGRHSHFECVTVSPPLSRPPEKRGSGATRSYAGGTYPLGWAILTWSARP
jgi:CRISPR-associated protein Csm5